MFASSSIDRGTRRAIVLVFTIVVEALLVIGLILATLAPGADGGNGSGPDRPPVPLASE